MANYNCMSVSIELKHFLERFFCNTGIGMTYFCPEVRIILGFLRKYLIIQLPLDKKSHCSTHYIEQVRKFVLPYRYIYSEDFGPYIV